MIHKCTYCSFPLHHLFRAQQLINLDAFLYIFQCHNLLVLPRSVLLDTLRLLRLVPMLYCVFLSSFDLLGGIALFLWVIVHCLISSPVHTKSVVIVQCSHRLFSYEFLRCLKLDISHEFLRQSISTASILIGSFVKSTNILMSTTR